MDKCKQVIAKALSYDDKGYLMALELIARELREQQSKIFHENVEIRSTKETEQLLKLCRLCADRVETISQQFVPSSPPAVKTGGVNLPVVYPKTNQPQGGTHEYSRRIDDPKEKVDVPLLNSFKQNKMLRQQFEKRLSKVTDPQEASDMNLQLMRKMMENVLLGKKQKKVLTQRAAQRQNELEKQIEKCQVSKESLRLFPEIERFNVNSEDERLKLIQQRLYELLSSPSHPIARDFHEMLTSFRAAFRKGMNDGEVIQEVQNISFKLVNKLTRTYVELSENEISRQQTVLAIDSILLPEVFDQVFGFYAEVNRDRDVIFAQKIFTEFANAMPWHFGIHRRYWLCDKAYGTDNTEYFPVIQLLQQISHYEAPISKLSCMVAALKKVQDCITSYWARFEGDVGAVSELSTDDFLAILCYTLVKANIPRLFAQIHFMSDFINEYLVKGEEGYALATLQTAAENLYLYTPQIMETNARYSQQNDLEFPDFDASAPPPSDFGDD